MFEIDPVSGKYDAFHHPFVLQRTISMTSMSAGPVSTYASMATNSVPVH